MKMNSVLKPHQREILDLMEKDPDRIVRAADVVEFAKNPDTALHSHFVWDDTSAGPLYRLQQAQGMIRTVKVTILQNEEENTDRTVTVRRLVSLPRDRDRRRGGYRDLGDVMSSEELRGELLASARREWQSFKAKYSVLEELSDGFDAMDRAIEA